MSEAGPGGPKQAQSARNLFIIVRALRKALEPSVVRYSLTIPEEIILLCWCESCCIRYRRFLK
jgi:hypothetical protein